MRGCVHKTLRARDLFQFALTDEGRRIRLVAMLQEFSGNFGSGAQRQLARILVEVEPRRRRHNVHDHEWRHVAAR